MDDFFNDVEEATAQVAKEKELAAVPVATNAIRHQKQSLGSAHEQIERILQDNYKWKNLNPFHVLDLAHTASLEDISRRYKALSLLLHPDKNQQEEKAQEAYDEVLKAKAILDDEHKYNHMRQLVEQGMKQGKLDWEKRESSSQPEPESSSLETYQTKAVARIFAQIEMERRQVEQRERNNAQRERQQEEDELAKERNERKFDKEWKQEERVEKRIGSWRNFNKKKKVKTTP